MNLSPANHDKLVKNARIWVAQTFYGEMLKQMRNSPFKSDLFDGGRGGEAFANQLDQKLAERMASGHAGDRLVQAIVRKIEHNPHSQIGPSPLRSSGRETATYRRLAGPVRK
jgi:Rod binding domain-containing protein